MSNFKIGDHVKFEYSNDGPVTGIIIKVREISVTVQLDATYKEFGWTDRRYGPDSYWNVSTTRIQKTTTPLGNSYE